MVSIIDVIESIARKEQVEMDYDQSLNEMTSAFSKIVESSQTLLHVVKKESTTLVKKKNKVMRSPGIKEVRYLITVIPK